MTEPDETGFDDELRRLARTLIDERAPEPAWRQDSLLRALQTFATIKGMSGTPDDLAACEALGAIKVREFTLGEVSF